METKDIKYEDIQIREDLYERLCAFAKEHNKDPEAILEMLVENALQDEQLGGEKFYG